MKKTKQYITRKTTFDSMHRVMNERMKCYNIHGHTYLCKLKFEFSQSEEIGYAIDFKEIKRIGCQFIDDKFDHGAILNPHDTELIEVSKRLNSKLWLMSLNGHLNYCNPSVENIAKEIFMSMEVLFQNYHNLKISKVIIYETPNCATTCIVDSISDIERENWYMYNYEGVNNYREEKGVINYDDRSL